MYSLKTLTALYLGGNAIGLQGAQYLADALQTNAVRLHSPLTTLYYSQKYRD